MEEQVAAEFAAIAIFAYNRVDRLRALIASLEGCRQFHASPVRIYVDGPRTLADSIKVDEVIKYTTSLDHRNIRVIKSKTNNGLRKSISYGVGQMLLDYDRVIVLEDDLTASNDLLEYFNASLEKYVASTRVFSVCGYIPFAKGISSHDRALILPSAHPWGWATWRRAWSGFDIALSIRPEDIFSRSFRTAFNLSGYRDYTEMLRFVFQGRIDSWFLAWNYYVFMKGGVSVFPPRSLVANSGFSSGTHSTRWNLLRYFYKSIPLARFDFELPSDTSIDYWAIDCLARSREAWLSAITTKVGVLKRMIRDRRL
jgi:hypothetical protein